MASGIFDLSQFSQDIGPTPRHQEFLGRTNRGRAGRARGSQAIVLKSLRLVPIEMMQRFFGGTRGMDDAGETGGS